MAFTCKDYRMEMLLLGLQQRLKDDTLSEKERKDLLCHISKIEKDLGLD